MKYQYSFQIPTPCSENWDEMTPAEMGKFCAHCQKTVIDFSEMTDNEVATFLHLHQNENICGNIEKSQTQKNYAFIESRITISPVKRYVMAMLAALMSASPNAAKATHFPLYSIEHTDTQKDWEIDSDCNDNPRKNIVSGKLVDKETGKPLAYVNIVFEYAATVYHLENKISAIEERAAKAKTPLSKAETQQKQLRIREIEREIAHLKEVISEHPDDVLTTQTDKNGRFSFELPDYLPKVELSLNIYLEGGGAKNPEGESALYAGKRAAPVQLAYNQNTENQLIKVQIYQQQKLRGMMKMTNIHH